METTQQVEFIKKVFNKVKLVEVAKYRKGEALREGLLNKLQSGEDIENYRLEFIKESVSKLFTFMEEIQKEFNAKYPDDKFTMNDMGDVFASALNVLKKIRN